MANIKSQKKRNLTNEKAHLKNVAVKSSIKTAIKKVRTAVNEEKIDEAKDLMKDVIRKIDVSVNKKILHKNQGAERKSKLQKLINQGTQKNTKSA